MECIDIVRRGVDAGVFPGAQVILRQEGRSVLEAEIGRRAPGTDAVQPSTRYDLASLTKALGTVSVFAHAWERSLVDLDEKLADTFDGAHPEIRLHHLLRHDSGLPAYRPLWRWLRPTLKTSSARRRWMAHRAAQTPIDRPVGEKAVYSDLGFIALGALLEQRLGSTLENSLYRLGLPLVGPGSTPLHGLAPSGAPAGCVHDENARAAGGTLGHAGLFGSAGEVARTAEAWLRAYAGEAGQPWSPQTVHRVWEPSPGSVWTLGWDRPTSGGSTGGAWPDASVGHLGFTGTSVWLHPPTGRMAILLTNRTRIDGSSEALRTLRQHFYQAAWRALG